MHVWPNTQYFFNSVLTIIVYLNKSNALAEIRYSPSKLEVDEDNDKEEDEYGVGLNEEN